MSLSANKLGRVARYVAAGALVNASWISLAFATSDQKIGSPIKSTSFRALLNTIINWILIFIGFVAVLYLIWSGFKYVTAGGDSKKAGEAKDAIVHAMIGIAVAMISVLLVQFLYKEVFRVNSQITDNVFVSAGTGGSGS